MPIYVYHNIRFLDSPYHPTIHTSDLYLTAVVQTDAPQKAYELTQHLEHPWEEHAQVRMLIPSRSTSVGDVLCLENGRLWVVAPIGFEPLPDMSLPLPGSAPGIYQAHTLRFLLPLLDYLAESRVLERESEGHRWHSLVKYGRLQALWVLNKATDKTGDEWGR